MSTKETSRAGCSVLYIIISFTNSWGCLLRRHDDAGAADYFNFKLLDNNAVFLNTGHTPTFNINPIEEIKKLHEEKMALYERMLKEKDEMMARLERLMEKQ